MARNVNLTITSENDGTTRNNVPDWLVHMRVDWIDKNNVAQEVTRDRYLLGQLFWFITNCPHDAQDKLQTLVYQIERVRQGIDDAEDIG